MLDFSKISEIAGKLYHRLGSFWRWMVSDPTTKVLRALHNAYATKVTQTSLDLEAVINKRTPWSDEGYMRRVRWYPLRIDLRDRNKANAAALKLVTGNHVKLDANSSYVLGDYHPEEGYVYYKLQTPKGTTPPDFIASGIFDGGKILVSNRDFVIREDSIIFRESDDPFESGRFNVSDDNTPGELFVRMWGFNVREDKGGLFKGPGHVAGVKSNSSDKSLEVVRAVWNMRNRGATRGTLLAYVGALYDIPTCKEEEEVVESINDDLLVTNKNVYVIDRDFDILVPGDAINYGDPLDGRIRILTPDTAPAATYIKKMFKDTVTPEYAAQIDESLNELAFPQTLIIEVEGSVFKGAPVVDISNIVPADSRIIIIEKRSVSSGTVIQTSDETPITMEALLLSNNILISDNTHYFMLR